jgi:carbon storage regulator
MLVLTRKATEKIQIGAQVTVTVIEVRGRYVRLGIEAPGSVRIIRKELMPAPASEPVPHDTAAPVPQPSDPGSPSNPR